MTSKSRILAAVAGALSMGAVATYAAEPSQADQISALEAKVAALEAKQASNSKDVAATIDSVLRDAEQRSQLLQNMGDMGAGYDNGFYIRSGEGWVMRPGVFFQFRNVTNWAEDSKHAGEDNSIENGFEVTRLRLELEGTAFTKDLEYCFVWESDAPNDNSMSLLDAYVRYMFADEWGVRAGQYKAITTHEFLTSEKRQLLVERSMVDALIGGASYNRVQGASLIYGGYNKDNPLSAEVSFHDGPNSGNTDFRKSNNNPLNPTENGSDFGLGGRAEYKVMGDWRDYRDFTGMGNKSDLLVIGGGADWSQFGDGNLYLLTLDGQWENSAGLGIYAAGLISYKDDDFFGPGGDNSTDWGFVAQIGYMLNPSWELAGRISYTHYDAEQVVGVVSEDSFWEFTVGVNYYLGNNGSAGHRAKISLDVSYLPDGSPRNLGFQDYQINDGNDEVVIRGQFQLLI